MTVSGTYPTRIHVRIFDETTQTQIAEEFTETWDVSLQSAGYNGIGIGYEKCVIDKWELLPFTWNNPGLPPRFN